MSVAPDRQAFHPTRVQAAQTRLLDAAAISLAEQVREVICEPTRAQMVHALSAGPLSVTDLSLAIGRTRTVISQHLRILRRAGLVRSRRRGRVVLYALVNDLVTRSALKILATIAQAAS
jgi:DNA-binding transcriptional ArsR family regulator